MECRTTPLSDTARNNYLGDFHLMQSFFLKQEDNNNKIKHILISSVKRIYKCLTRKLKNFWKANF